MPRPDVSRVNAHLPVKPVVLHILLALADQPLHGYGVIQSVRARSDQLIRLETGTFYRHLRKLLDHGLVSESDDRPPDDDPRRGVRYELTSLGRAVLRAESRRLASLVDATRELGILRGEPGV